MEYQELTKKEKKVIEDKGTERPFTGEYDDFFRKGLYICRRCHAPLYRSEDKFDAGCGWPSFDAEIDGAVKRSPDADGVRTEITCNNCGAHLGHVFTGEKHTEKNTRHCVNSISMKFIPKSFAEDEEHFAVLGGGCFWCQDSMFSQLKGVKKVTAGYAGGSKIKPSYEEVCTGVTGHAEVVKIVFDPKTVSYQDLLEVFFGTHDPTTPNRQGNDVGEQYRSIILYATLDQKDKAEKFIKQIEKDKIYKDKIVTQVQPLTDFYEAEDYHQDYYDKNPNAGYCQTVINPKLAKFRKKFKELLKN